jgi:cellulose synthase/poly-beta-1,6-N-acetylglucosamine synthase-like glycosyltransferase
MLIELAVVLLVLYAFLIFQWIRGNKTLDPAPLEKQEEIIQVSIVIPFRNEATNLESLIDSLLKQNYKTTNFEVLLVDDHSDDNGSEILKRIVGNCPNVQLLELHEAKGKKAALKKGIENARHDVIVTTDADCIMGEEWLTSMMSFFQDHDTHLLTGPVQFKHGSKFAKLLQAELTALMASTSGSIGAGKAFMCNGANLAFRREVYERVNKEFNHDNLASGDDVFLLHGVKKLYGNDAIISFAADERAGVQTSAPSSLKQFIHQRVRWAKKSSKYKDLNSILAGTIIFLTNLSILIGAVLLVSSELSWKKFLIYFIVKWGLDWLLINSAKKWLPSVTFSQTFLLSIIYPFYVSGVAFLSLLLRPNWKGRKT